MEILLLGEIHAGLKRTRTDAIFKKVLYENDRKIKNKSDPEHFKLCISYTTNYLFNGNKEKCRRYRGKIKIHKYIICYIIQYSTVHPRLL
jgi:hypothetical protein